MGKDLVEVNSLGVYLLEEVFVAELVGEMGLVVGVGLLVGGDVSFGGIFGEVGLVVGISGIMHFFFFFILILSGVFFGGADFAAGFRRVPVFLKMFLRHHTLPFHWQSVVLPLHLLALSNG